MPSAPTTVSRRRVLVGVAAAALLGGAGVACGSTPPVKQVDDLVDQLDRALSDGRLAAIAATGASPTVAAALTVVAAERNAHAKALTDEITRISGETPTTSTTATSTTASSATATSTTSPAAAATTTAPPPPAPAAVVAALKESATGAALLSAQQSGYRAGLLGSIAAACTAAATVALATSGPNA